MSELILPKTGLLLVSGINSDAFYEGYDQTCGIFDKSKTLMKDPDKFWAIDTNNKIYQRAINMERLVHYADEESIDAIHKDDPSYFHEDNLFDAAKFAIGLAESYGGKPLILAVKHPSCKLEGIDYKVECNTDWVSIEPSKVKLEKILNIKIVEYFDENKSVITTLKLEEAK